MKSCCKEATSDNDRNTEPQNKKSGLRRWLKRIGIAGFAFFLLKGLVWVFVFWGGARMLGCG